MKKIISTSIIILCLLFFQTHYSFGQNTKKEKATKETNTDDMDDEGDIPNDANASTRKAHHEQAGAQKVRFGIEAGLNMSKINETDQTTLSNGGVGTVKYTYDFKAGGRAGIIIDVPVSRQLYVQPGIFYAMNGTTHRSDDGDATTTITYNINTIEVPLNIIYKFGEPQNNHFFIGAGPFLGYNISASENMKYKENIGNYSFDTTITLTIGSTDGTDHLKPINLGLEFSLGDELANGLFFRLRYQLGLANIYPSTLITGRISCIGLQIGYLFGTKAPQKHNQRRDDYVEHRLRR